MPNKKHNLKVVPVHGGFRLSSGTGHRFEKHPITKKMAQKQLAAVQWSTHNIR